MLRIRICISFIPVPITELYIRLDNLAAIFEANSKPNRCTMPASNYCLCLRGIQQVCRNFVFSLRFEE